MKKLLIFFTVLLFHHQLEAQEIFERSPGIDTLIHGDIELKIFHLQATFEVFIFRNGDGYIDSLGISGDAAGTVVRKVVPIDSLLNGYTFSLSKRMDNIIQISIPLGFTYFGGVVVSTFQKHNGVSATEKFLIKRSPDKKFEFINIRNDLSSQKVNHMYVDIGINWKVKMRVRTYCFNQR